MTGSRSASRADRLQAIVGVCAFGGVFSLLWAAGTGYGPAFGLALALWVVGGVLSFGVDGNGGPTDDGLAATNRETAESVADVAGPGDRATADALETLRERYARGEVTETEFERRVERLLATDPTDANDGAFRALRERYARGELSDDQFDRKLDRLTATRTLEDAADTYEREESPEG